jgi:hypothetical protein
MDEIKLSEAIDPQRRRLFGSAAAFVDIAES